MPNNWSEFLINQENHHHSRRTGKLLRLTNKKFLQGCSERVLDPEEAGAALGPSSAPAPHNPPPLLALKGRADP